MNFLGASKRAIATGAAWAAAYALVFQLFCAGLLLASFSPASADVPLCITGIHGQSGPVQDSAGTSEAPLAKAGVYCPLCTAHAFGHALLPQAPLLFRPAVIPAPAPFVLAPQVPVLKRVYNERARDPPSLA